MTVPYDVVLPHVSVLGSTMAYREAGNPDDGKKFTGLVYQGV